MQMNHYAQEESGGGETYRHMMVNPAPGQTILASPKREPYVSSQKGLRQEQPERMLISEVDLNKLDQV